MSRAREFRLKANDTAPPLELYCLHDGENVDITGASARFHMRPVGGAQSVDAAATIVTAAEGLVRYSWQAADTDETGRFEAEFEITYSGGSVESFPNDGHITVIITDDVG